METRYVKYDKQDQQGKAASIERIPYMTQQQEQMTRSPGGPQTKKQDRAKAEHGQVNH
jgi:hypothetical protein